MFTKGALEIKWGTGNHKASPYRWCQLPEFPKIPNLFLDTHLAIKPSTVIGNQTRKLAPPLI